MKAKRDGGFDSSCGYGTDQTTNYEWAKEERFQNLRREVMTEGWEWEMAEWGNEETNDSVSPCGLFQQNANRGRIDEQQMQKIKRRTISFK
jgi:hypothetical protein